MNVARAEVEPGLWVDGRRAVYLATARAVVISDLHFGYELAQRAAGHLFPGWGRDEAVARVEGLLRDWEAERLILLGDLVHGRSGWQPLAGWLRGLQVEVVAVRGNHDRGAPPGFGLVEAWRWEKWRLHHGDRDLGAEEGTRDMVGHWHPAVVLQDGAGLRRRLPALVVGEWRVVLPAFSPWAGGSPGGWVAQAGDRVWAIAPGAIAPWLKPG